MSGLFFQLAKPLGQVVWGDKDHLPAALFPIENTALAQVQQICPGRLVNDIVTLLMTGNAVLLERMLQGVAEQLHLPVIEQFHEYAYGVKGDLSAYLAEAQGRYRRPVVCQDYDAPLDIFDRHLYEKGGLVLHALRMELGDAIFWRGIRRYLESRAGGLVETRDLQRALEDESGRSLARFFDQAIHKPGHPEIEVQVTWDRGVLAIATKQTQSATDGVPACFQVILDMDLGDLAGSVTRRRVSLTERQQTFAIPAPVRPAFVVLDPEGRIVGEVRPKAPGDMLREQLAKAPTARGRWLAAQAMGRSDDGPTIEALASTLTDEGAFWGTRVECAASLGKIRAPECFQALKDGLRTAHPKVRRAVVDALGGFKTLAAFEAIRPMALRDPSYLVEAEAARALGRTRQASAFDVLVEALGRPSWYEVVRAGALDGLAALRDERGTAQLVERTRYGNPPRARRAAVLGLPKLASDARTRESLELLLDDVDPMLRLDVARALGDLGTRSRVGLSASGSRWTSTRASSDASARRCAISPSRSAPTTAYGTRSIASRPSTPS